MTFWDGTRWVPDPSDQSSIARARPRLFGAVAEASLITLLIFGLIAGSALAAPGGNGKGKGGGGKPAGGTISLVLLDGNDSVANYGERAAFDVTTGQTDRPFVGVRCYQGAAWIYDAYTGYFADYRSDPWVTLASPYWDTTTSAACAARLFYYDKHGYQQILATTDFTVAP